MVAVVVVAAVVSVGRFLATCLSLHNFPLPLSMSSRSRYNPQVLFESVPTRAEDADARGLRDSAATLPTPAFPLTRPAPQQRPRLIDGA